MERATGPAVLADLEQELANAGDDDTAELVNRRRYYQQGLEVPYISRTDSGEPIYLQWLVGEGDQRVLHQVIPQQFPHLAPGEFLVEGAYTFAAFRRMGVMVDGMYQLVAEALARGGSSVRTYVSFGNIGALRGCAAVGFEPDHVRITTQRMGRRRSTYVPVDEEAWAEWRRAVPAEVSPERA